jgi:hypothetical protein
MAVHRDVGNLLVWVHTSTVETFMKNFALVVEFSGVGLSLALAHFLLALFQTLDLLGWHLWWMDYPYNSSIMLLGRLQLLVRRWRETSLTEGE